MQHCEFGVFLSHNSQDKAEVLKLATKLRQLGLNPWLDAWCLVPGEPWLPAIERALANSDSCAVIVGPDGLGNVHEDEMWVALQRGIESKRTDRRFRVIPVLLPNATRGDRARLPTFLTANTWVEFHRSIDDPAALEKLNRAIRGEASGAGTKLAKTDCPYRGLAYFDIAHAPLFFGREALTDWLLSRLRGTATKDGPTRFLAIMGASGSGKSSLARAGVLARLQLGELSGSSNWPLVICRPDRRPLESLATALGNTRGVNLGTGLKAELLKQLESSLLQSPEQLHRVAQGAMLANDSDWRLVVFVDQFEEIFTLNAHRSGESQFHSPAKSMLSDDRSAFVRNLLHAATIENGRTIVILTMRADFYAKCTALPELAAAVSAHQQLVGPMNADELRSAIEAPAQLVGSDLEAGLVDLLVREVSEQPGALPLLQYALAELWKTGTESGSRRLTATAYRDLGGWEGALRRRADAVFAKFRSLPQEQLCRQLFLRLVQPGEGTEDTKRLVRWQELQRASMDEAGALESIVRELADERLITTSGDDLTSESTIEVVHEALIRGWPELRTWLETDRESLRFQHRLTEDSKEWSDRKKDADYLYKGSRLAQARDWFPIHASELSETEQTFLAASIEREDWELRATELRQQRELEQARQFAEEAEARRQAEERLTADARQHAAAAVIAATNAQNSAIRERSLKWVSYVITGVAMAVTAWAYYLRGLATEKEGQATKQEEIAKKETKNAQRQTRIAESHRLTALSQNAERDKRLGVSTLLAVDAVRSTPEIEGERRGEPLPTSHQHLLDVVQSIGGRPLIGHNNAAHRVAISSDSRWIVTGSIDNTARLWDLRSADPTTEPLVLQGHDAMVADVAISPDSRWVVTVSHDYSARVWDLQSADPTVNPLVLQGHEGYVKSVAISPDSRWVVTGSLDKTARIWDLQSANPAATPRVLKGHEGEVTSIAISSGSRWVVTGSADSTGRVWDLESSNPTVNPRVLRGHQSWVASVAISSDSRWVVTVSHDYSARVWDLQSADPAASPYVLQGHTDLVASVAISRDNRWLVTGSFDKTALLWDLQSNDWSLSLRELKGHEDIVSSVAISPDSRWIVTGSHDKTARLWDLQSANPTANPRVLKGHEAAVASIAISPDSRWVVTGSYDKTARIWGLPADRTVNPQVLKAHKQTVSKVAISPDSRWVVTGSHDKTARLWDLQSAHPTAKPRLLDGHEREVNSVAISPDSRWLVTGSEDKTARLWNLKSVDSAVTPRVLKGHEAGVASVAISPDSRWVVTGSQDNTARLWDLQSADPTANSRVLKGHDSWVSSVAFGPDSRWVVTGSLDKTARKWDLQSADPTANPLVLRGHEDMVFSVAISPDSRWIVTGSLDKTARIWDLKSANPAATSRVLKGHEAAVRCIAISPDSRWIVTQSDDKMARLWDLQSDDRSFTLRVLKGHEDLVSSVAISPDSHWVITGSRDKTARLWDLHSADPAATPRVLKGHEGDVTSIAISPDGRWIVTGSDDNTARLWRWQPDDLIEIARQAVGRNFTQDEWKEFFPSQTYRKTFDDLPGAGPEDAAKH